MPLEPKHAVQTISQLLRKEHPLLDLWTPDTKDPKGTNRRGTFFDSPSRPALRAPHLLGDDGNMLLAVVLAPSDGEKRASTWERFANDGIRLLANLLRRAADDHGLHRLLLILILPENEVVTDSLHTALASSRITSGEFRYFMLPHLNQSESVFHKEAAEVLKLFSPFPNAPFLEPTRNEDLAAYVDEVFLEDNDKNPFLTAIKRDIKTFLTNGDWLSHQDWPAVTKVLDDQTRATHTGTEEQ